MPPLQILDIQETGFEIKVDNFNSVLNKVPDLPIVLLSINGCMREGKSFVLSYFIRYLKHQGQEGWFEAELKDEEMFSWRSGSNRETIGINIWSEPFVTRTEEGRKVAVILLDCQGLFDPETTEQQNPGIFAFSCLLSSIMIYNTKKQVEENLLANIQQYSNYAGAIAGKSPHRQDTRPYFLFLLRDFEFVTEFDFGFHNKEHRPKVSKLENPGNYYDKIFTHTLDMHEENRQVRKEISECYKDIGMFLMPRPGTKFIKNSRKFPPSTEFQESLKELTKHVMSNLVTKKIGAQEATGTTLQSHIKRWADLCKSKEFPKAETIAEMEMKLENENAKIIAVAEFSKNCKKLMTSSNSIDLKDPNNCRDKLRPLIEDTVKFYKNSRILGDADDVRRYVLDLSTTCARKFNDEVEMAKKQKLGIREIV